MFEIFHFFTIASVLYQKPGDEDGDDIDHFDDRVDGGTRGVFVGVANRVPGNHGFVGVRAFTAQ